MLHACFGAYGWYNRYECYIFAALIYGILIILIGSERQIFERWTHANTAVLALVGLVVSFPYVIGLFSVPLASNDIYIQQFQMHRFTTEWWKKPFAVNDLGWASFQNDAYVLDLWGLGSHQALEARKEGRDRSWMTDLARKHGVELAMVYESWVPCRAAGWTKVAELRMSRRPIVAAESDVSFFAVTPSEVGEIESLLADFRKSLPPDASLVLRSEAGGDPQAAPAGR